MSEIKGFTACFPAWKYLKTKDPWAAARYLAPFYYFDFTEDHPLFGDLFFGQKQKIRTIVQAGSFA
jgi:hypothetical protein